jgi:hypothetical protein
VRGWKCIRTEAVKGSEPGHEIGKYFCRTVPYSALS